MYLKYYENAFLDTKSDNLQAKSNGTKSKGIELSFGQVTTCKSSDFDYDWSVNFKYLFSMIFYV